MLRGPLHLPLQHTANRVLEASGHGKGEDCTGVDMRERHSGRENRLDLLEIRDPGGGPGKKLQIVTKAAVGGTLVWIAMDRNSCKKVAHAKKIIRVLSHHLTVDNP
jgi:hypothetical protein